MSWETSGGGKAMKSHQLVKRTNALPPIIPLWYRFLAPQTPSPWSRLAWQPDEWQRHPKRMSGRGKGLVRREKSKCSPFSPQLGALQFPHGQSSKVKEGIASNGWRPVWAIPTSSYCQPACKLMGRFPPIQPSPQHLACTESVSGISLQMDTFGGHGAP